MNVINGKVIAQKIISELKTRPRPEKIFAAVLVGGNPASIPFLKLKEKTAKELGIDFRLYEFLETISEDNLEKEISKISAAEEVGGMIVQLPLPEHIDKRKILNIIPAEKDVDVLSERAFTDFINGNSVILPPPIGVVEEILNSQSLILNSQKVAVVGFGFLIGQPIVRWLKGKTKEIYIIDKGGDYSILKNVDLVITGVGKAGLIKPEMLKDGAGVIDFGVALNKSGLPAQAGKISGDFDASFLTSHPSLLKFYTPTPGGTGPILIAKLMENFWILNSRQYN